MNKSIEQSIQIFFLACFISIAQAQEQPFGDASGNPIRLTADTTFYVATWGTDDANHGASATTPFRTPAYALRWVSANVDAAGFALIVQVAPGIYTDEVLLCDVAHVKPGGWPTNGLILRGNPENPFYGPVLSVSGSAAVLAINSRTTWIVEGFQLQSTVCDVEADSGSWIYVRNNLHGMNGDPLATPQKFSAIYGGVIEMLGDEWFLSGGNQLVWATNLGQFIQLNHTACRVWRGAPFQRWYVSDDIDPQTGLPRNIAGLGVVFF